MINSAFVVLTYTNSNCLENCACIYLLYTIMPISYSMDFRWRIIWIYLVKESIAAISELCSVSESSVRCYIDRFSQTGEVKPTECQHRPCTQQLVLLRIVLQNPGLYLNDIQSKLFTAIGQTVSGATICQTLHHMVCTRQALQHIAIQRSEERAKFMAEISTYNPDG